MTAQSEFDFNAPPRAEAMPASAAILARIRKLLRLGADKRGNSREAEAAMAMAFELAEKYRVDVAGLDLDEETRRVLDERWPVGARYDTLRRGVFGVLRSYFHVTTCLARPEMIVIGKPADLAIARYVHDFLLRAGRECLRSFEAAEKAARRRMTPAKRTGYLQGFIYGIHANLQRTHEQLALGDAHAALVVVEEAEREARLNELVPQRVTLSDCKQRRNKTALMHGYQDGRATQIHTPLGGGHREAPLQLA